MGGMEKYFNAVGFEPMPFLTDAFNHHPRPLDQACVLSFLSENIQLLDDQVSSISLTVLEILSS